MVQHPFVDAQLATVAGRSGVAVGEVERALLVELWGRRADAAARDVELPAAEALGAAAAEAGEGPGAPVRRVLALGRALGGAAVARGAIAVAEVEGLSCLTDEAAARAALAHARWLHGRREEWLSFLAHELKNPLNTVLNALWLLREGRGGAGADRFLQLAERAVRKMEAEIQGLRELERRIHAAPPRPQLQPPEQ